MLFSDYRYEILKYLSMTKEPVCGYIHELLDSGSKYLVAECRYTKGRESAVFTLHELVEVKKVREVKRYRLEIPEEVPKKYDELAWAWHYENGNEINESMSISISKPFSEWTSKFSHLPKSWLTEIKEEPENAEDWVMKQESFNKSHAPFTRLDMIEAYKSGEKNYEFKHRETKSLKQIEAMAPEKPDPECQRCWIQGIRYGHIAAQKSRGYE